jgi:Tol biopolymer transport system component
MKIRTTKMRNFPTLLLVIIAVSFLAPFLLESVLHVRAQQPVQTTQVATPADCRTLAGPHAHSPSWSPDGKYVAFVTKTDDNAGSQYYIMNADGSNQRRLSHPDDTYEAASPPVWSPDSKHIAYAMNKHEVKESGVNTWIRVYAIDPDLSNERVVDAIYPASFHSVMPGDVPIVEPPSWSPDSKQLAFTRNTTRGGYMLYIINADGSGSVLVSDKSIEPARPVNPGFFPAAWSPTGNQLAFIPAGLDLINSDGSNLTHLVTGRVNEARWSPDGQQIIFAVTSGSSAGIYSVDIHTGTERKLALGPASGLPMWSPDSRYLAFDYFRLGGGNSPNTQEIVIKDNKSSVELQLTYGRFNTTSFTWSGDSKQIAFDKNNSWIYVVQIDAPCKVPDNV